MGSSTIPAVQELIADLTLVVEQQCARCENQEPPLPGSSEVIESLIGKAKRLLGTSQAITFRHFVTRKMSVTTRAEARGYYLPLLRDSRISRLQKATTN